MSSRSFAKYLQRIVLLAPFLIGYSIQLHADDRPAPIRFLLTFDDGPSGSLNRNPTALTLATLEKNTVQPGIKAIFFLQTRAALSERGSAIAHSLMLRQQADGHLLAFHTATPHHTNHRLLSAHEFELSLSNGIADITAVTGVAPRLVRPPFWNYDSRTLATYNGFGLQMLLTDLSANDGMLWGINWNWGKHRNLRNSLRAVKANWANGKMPSVDGSTPIVVTFHDVSGRTSRNIEAYLTTLLSIAKELDMEVAAKPFYDTRAELERAALLRCVQSGDSAVQLPGFWNWFWK